MRKTGHPVCLFRYDKHLTMTDFQRKGQIIKEFIHAYNRFDVEGMLQHIDENIHFENISDGQVTLKTDGLEEFRTQAQQALSYFSEREQRILKMEEKGDWIEVTIDYKATLAIDFPDGSKKGDPLALKGTSMYQFKGDKIIRLVDII